MRKLMFNHQYIAVAGNIASGKTSLVTRLAKENGLQPYYEANDLNPYLTDFYENMNQWSFHSQTFFLIQKFKIHQQLENTKNIALLDRTLYEDAEIFAKRLYVTGKMSARDYALYRDFYLTLRKTLKPPKLMIYLRCPIEELERRIVLRGRPSEQSIPREYLQGLQDLYEEWILDYQESELIVLDSTKPAESEAALCLGLIS
ncbi:MAG: deoxynucleoside kinase [Myxococcota bacterium]